mgnify:CR=1 FL=1
MRGWIDEGLETGELDLRESHGKMITLRRSSLDALAPKQAVCRRFPILRRERDYRIHMEIPEFTCLCPMTGQPDFATLALDYVADQLCVELKSLKLYVWSFRNEGAFHEAVTNRILDDLVRATRPRYMRLEAKFNVARRHLHQRDRRAPRSGA